MAVLVPNLSGSGDHNAYNFGMAETYSYIPIANDQNRPIFAKASYITNFSDLAVSLSTGDLNIGAVHIQDWNNGLYASIADVSLGGLDSGKGAVRVLTQDFESDVDDITIGDRNKNYASVNAATSALNVYTVNGISAVSLTNQITSVSLTNFPKQLTAVSVTNFPTQLTAVSVTNQLTGITVLNPVSSFSLTNQITSVSVTNFPTQLTAVSITNQLTGITILNPVTAVTINNPISAFDIIACNLTLPVSGGVTINNPISGNTGIAVALNWGVTIVAVTSSAYVQFPSNTAHIASLMNTTGGILYVGKWNNSSTVGLPLPNNSSIEINLTGNTNEIGIKSTVSGTVSAYVMYTDWN